jgi:hypothetical protein
MNAIAFAGFKPGVTMNTIAPLLREEVAHAWRLWKRGIVREIYSRVDQSGVVLVFEAENAEAAMRSLAVPNDEGGLPRMDLYSRDCAVPA